MSNSLEMPEAKPPKSCLRSWFPNTFIIVKDLLLANRIGTYRENYAANIGKILVISESGGECVFDFKLDENCLNIKKVLRDRHINLTPSTIIDAIDPESFYFDIVATIGFMLPTIELKKLVKKAEDNYTAMSDMSFDISDDSESDWKPFTHSKKRIHK